MSVLERVEVLMLVAALVAMLARRLRLPYTVGLLVAGFVLAFANLGTGITLTKDLVFTAFLPPLVFEAAYYIPWDELRRDLRPTLVLASVGVLVSAGFTAAGMHLLVGWSWTSALVFGALIAATDPVSVIATFKEAGVHGRLRLLVEAESLLNDGVAAVLFSVVLAWATGAHLTAGSIGATLAREIVGGVLCGLAVGWAILWVAGKTEDHLVEITFTTVAAFGSFLLAQHLHCSGVLSTLVCGLLLGNRGSLGAISDRGREAVISFWEYAAFVVNSLIFLLIGARVASVPVGAVVVPAIVGFVVSALSRGVAVYPLCACFARTDQRIRPAHQHILFWGGLRGALALALALGLPPDLPNREVIAATAFGVVAASIVLQGITMPPLLRRLRLIGPDTLPEENPHAHVPHP